HVGSRLAVASSAKTSRPRPAAGRTAGARCRSRKKASTSAERDFSGSWSLSALIRPPLPRARTCSGHPRLEAAEWQEKSWMAGTSPAKGYFAQRLACSCRAQPDGGVVKHRASAGQARVGAGVQIDADAFL